VNTLPGQSLPLPAQPSPAQPSLAQLRTANFKAADLFQNGRSSTEHIFLGEHSAQIKLNKRRYQVDGLPQDYVVTKSV
jgi:hypothetical protein